MAGKKMSTSGDIGSPIQYCLSPCQQAQAKVQDEMEDIKNSFNHKASRRGRGNAGFITPPPTELGETHLMPSQYREINRNISAAYGRLAKDAPHLPWTPVAHVVASQFGCNMDALDLGATTFENSPEPASGISMANQMDDAARAIGAGCIRIFDNLYPTMRLVADIGYDKFLECVDQGALDPPPPDKMVEAIRKLQQGKFDEAEELIIKFEQVDVASTIYRDYAPQYAFMHEMASMGKKIGVNAESVLPTTRCAFAPGFSKGGIEPVAMDGVLTNADDRVTFYNKFKPFVEKYYNK